MKSFLSIVLFISAMMGCKQKNMSLEELRDARWDSLLRGIEYISLEKNTSTSGSIQFTFKGIIKKNTILLDEEDAAMLLALYTYAKPLTNEKLSHSKKGYLKINFANMLSDSLEARITLDPLYDTVSLAKDIEFFRQIDGVLDIKYISKEMAKSEYLADGNESWDKVLKDNPLPQSFELKLNPEKITFDNYLDFESKIKEKVQLISDIAMPLALLKGFEKKYYILEYYRP